MFRGVLALLIQIALTAAAPIEAQAKNDVLGYRIGGGIGGFILLVLDIIVWCKHMPATFFYALEDHHEWLSRVP